MTLPQGVILDMDDTLFCEYDFVVSGYSAVSRALRIEGMTEDALLARLLEIFQTEDRSRAFDALLTPLGRGDLIPEAVKTYRNHSPDISLTHEADELVARLADVRSLAIVTDGPASMQRQKAQALGVEQRVDAVIYSDDIAGRDSWKPSPVPYLAAAERLGLPPTECVYVGDNPHKDFLGAHRAGMASIRFRAEWQLHSKCEADNAHSAAGREVSSLTYLTV